MRIPVLISVLALSFLACKDPKDISEPQTVVAEAPASPTLHNKIESDDSWIGQVTYHEVGDAHSGNMVSIVDEKNLFGVGIRKKRKNFPMRDAQKLQVNLWVKYADTTGVRCALVYAVKDKNGKTIDWIGLPIERVSVLIPNQWVEVKGNFPLVGKSNDPDDEIEVYVWNTTGKKKVMIDDMSVTFSK